MKSVLALLFIAILLVSFEIQPEHGSEKPEKVKMLKALIIDGENNHGVWPLTTILLKDYLEQTGLFEVDIERTAYTWQGGALDKKALGVKDAKELLTLYPLPDGKKTTAVDQPIPDPDYSPDFAKYDVVVSNFGARASDWPDATQKAFEKYMAKGGGLVIVHAANNSWAKWPEYNEMIGVGGWDGRNEESGPFVYYDNANKLHHNTSEGKGGGHGPQHEYILQTRAPDHPIMKGLPEKWIHTKDELYHQLRGPAKNMTILATAWSDSEKRGTERHEPLLFTINYGKGRVFHTALGHMDYSMECVGFMATFQRGAEWVATGKVTQPVPADFPTEKAVSLRKWKKRH
ncbi:MAG: ThuA domain-containing protein [Cyclobacteriaceae bacterium]|nr:ThuA domain-containing protein [Cyclobacteriaceae bacterium]